MSGWLAVDVLICVSSKSHSHDIQCSVCCFELGAVLFLLHKLDWFRKGILSGRGPVEDVRRGKRLVVYITALRNNDSTAAPMRQEMYRTQHAT